MSAAKTAAERGHKVTLFEKSARLGGQLFAAEKAPHREGWGELRKVLVQDMKRLGVKVLLKTAFKPADAAELKPDAVILAVGSTASVPKIPGIGRTNVTTSREILEGRAKAKGDVVIVGGGCAGAQTAEHLASQGRKVTIIEAAGDIAVDAPVDDRNLLLGRLAKRGVRTMTNTSVMSIGEDSVQIEHAAGTGAVRANTVVLCLGSFPNDGLAAETRSVVKSVTVVGDAKEARRVTEAVLEGSLAALAL
jgi:pyruvate/2-oxoglutarate dehydrogenase complex dihydrolipoamide dehydrogenase (E3) component